MPFASDDLERRQVAKLLQHVREDNRDGIRHLVAGGVEGIINYTDASLTDGGDTALGLAASMNRDDLLDFLLGPEIEAHPDAIDGRRRTAVMKAAEYGHLQSVERLVQNKPAPNLTLKDCDGKGLALPNLFKI